MKFNWGTGILMVLIVFLAACAVFIIFAMRQDVNLVHKNYYEKGVDYTDQMNTNARSANLTDSIRVSISKNQILVGFEGFLASAIDSGKVHLFRPSSSKLDIFLPMEFSGNNLIIENQNMLRGRYILKLSWYSEGLKFEVDKPIDIP